MRLITWNCKGGFDRKHSSIVALAPDVLVLPECGRLRAVSNVIGAAPVRSFKWIGENPNKGLGVVSYGEYAVDVHPDYDPTVRWILPLQVNGPTSFLLLAVWTVPDPADGIYAHALFRALTQYDALVHEQPTIIAGDFNQSVRFDKPRSRLNFAEWIAAAEKAGLHSAYHLQRACAHGSEPEQTFYLHHSEAKGHHIDFVFASSTLVDAIRDVTVGAYSDWSKLSDHAPLGCTFGPIARDA